MDIIKKDIDRFSIIDDLDGDQNVGIELGVAAGGFSARLAQSGKFKRLFGVDLYSDHHDQAEYKRALRTIGLDSNYSLLKMSFDEALGLFPDDYFDFIYIDGYAHTGEQGGKTFFDWLPKLKSGGILAGDDYSHHWPLVQESVHYFVEQVGGQLHITDDRKTEPNSDFNKFPSWFIFNKDLKDDWKRNADMEAKGAEIAQVTQQNHDTFLELGRTFNGLIQEALQGKPTFVNYGDKRIFVVAK